MRIGHKLLVITMVAAMAIAVCSVAALAQGPRGGGRGQGGPGMMDGTVPGVQLSQEQQQEIAQIRQETQQQVQAVRTDPDLTPQQKAERIQEIQSAGHERVLGVLTPEQRQQFQQWWDSRYRAGVGRRGARVGPGPRMPDGTVPGVQLSQEQQQEIAQIRQETQQQVQAVRTDPNLTPAQRTQRIQEIQSAGHERVLGVLTPEQRQQFQQWWDGRMRAGRGGPRR